MWIVVGEFLFLVKKSLKTRKQISTFLLSLLEIRDMDSIFLFLFSILASHQCLVYADRITTPHSAMIFGFHWGNIFQKPVKFLASVNFQKIQLQEYHGTRDCLYLCQPIRSWYESRLQLNGAIPLFCTKASTPSHWRQAMQCEGQGPASTRHSTRTREFVCPTRTRLEPNTTQTELYKVKEVQDYFANYSEAYFGSEFRGHHCPLLDRRHCSLLIKRSGLNEHQIWGGHFLVLLNLEKKTYLL